MSIKLDRALNKTEKETVVLYEKYIRELSRYSARLAEENSMEVALESWLSFWDELHNYMRIMFLYNEEQKKIGFLLVGVGANCPPDADYYIQEIYVEPKYRKNGVAERALYNFFRNHPGNYCLFILNQNEPAKKFWARIFYKFQALPIDLQSDYSPDDCKQYSFAITAAGISEYEQRYKPFLFTFEEGSDVECVIL